MKPGVVIPVTGGMDSALLLYEAVRAGYDTHPIILDTGYGKVGTLDKNLVPAMNIVREAGLHERIKVIPFFPTSIQTISDGKYGYTPGWNMSIAMAALSYAEFVKATQIWLGFNASQEGYYPDQKQAMFDELAALYAKTYSYNIEIKLPLAGYDRTYVAKRGTELGIPFHLTVSCVNTPIPVNCGVCARCQQRRSAFKGAGVTDETIYLKDM